MKKQILLSLFSIMHLCGYSQQADLANSPVVDTLKFLTSNYKFQEALEYIERQEPTRSMLIEKALCYKSLGDNNKSCAVLLGLAQEYPKDIYILNELASSFQAIGKWKAGEQCYDRLIEIDSTNVYFKIKKGDMLYNQGEYDKAIDTYTQIYLENRTPSILKQLGRSYEAEDMIDSAQLYYSKAREHDLTDSQAAILYANISLKQKDIPTALHVCETYLERDSTNNQLNRIHALAYYMMDEYKTAASLFEKCVSEGDETLLVNRNLGFCYYSLEDPRSYDFLNKAYVQDTTNNSVLYRLAAVCNDLKKSEEAINHYSTLLNRVIPKHSSLYLYYRGLATAYADNEEYEKAIERYKKAIGYGSENQQALMRIAIAELYDYNLKDQDNALIYYKLYQADLQRYIDKLKDAEVVNPNQINDAERRLRALNQYIEYIDE